MTIKVRSEGFQHPRYAIARFTSNDFDGTNFVPMLTLPGSAIPIGGFLSIDAVADGTRTATVGTSGTPAAYLAATAIDALAKTALLAALQNAGKPLGTKQVIGITPNAALTQGSGYLVVEYIESNAAVGTQD